MFKQLHINILVIEALEQMSKYVKFLKDIISKKRKWEDHEKVMLIGECSVILQRKLPPKLKDPEVLQFHAPLENLILLKYCVT